MLHKVKVGASILSARFSHLAEEIERVERSGADFLHFDIMDGSITNAITFGPSLIKSLRKLSNLPFDVHCYLLDPMKHIESVIDSGADSITIHIEASGEVFCTLDLIRERGIETGIALLPETPPLSISQVLDVIDSITIVTVDVMRYGSWRFIPSMLRKIKETRELIGEARSRIELKADGGINLKNARDVIAAGARSLVVGGALFGSNNMAETVRSLKEEDH